MQEVYVQVRYKQNVPEVGTDFNDAIYYTMKEWENVAQEDIDAEITKRIDDFVSKVQNPIEIPEPTKEEIEEAIRSLNDQIQILNAKKAELATPEQIKE
jgi:gas vesicle protein